MMMTIAKHPPLVEDLRKHSQEQIAELRMLLHSGAPIAARSAAARLL